MKTELLHQSVNLILKLRAAVNSSSVVPKSLSNQIIATAAEIEQLYKSELSARYIDYSKDQSVQKRIKQPREAQPIKKQSPQCKEILSRDCLNERIFPYLTIYDLIKVRQVSSSFKDAVEHHFRLRIPIEEKWMAHHLFSSVYLRDLKEFLFKQIPGEDWIIYDQLEAKRVIKEFAREPDLVRKLRTVPPQFDVAFKPLIHLWASPAKPRGSYFEAFKKLQLKGQFKEQNVQAAILAFREVDMKKIQKFSSETYKTLLWCQAQISLYILENIFIVRVDEDSEIAEIAQFYRYHQHIINVAKKILKQEQRFVIFLNFTPFFQQAQLGAEDSSKPASESQLELLLYILQYLDLKSLLKMRLVSKDIREGVQKQLKQNLITQIYKYELYKLCYYQENRTYELGFFNPIFDMCYTFLVDKHRELAHSSNFEHVKVVEDEMTFCLDFAFQHLHKQANLKSTLVQTNLIRRIQDNLNPFGKQEKELDLAEQALDQLTQTVQANPKIQFNFQIIFPFYLYLKLYVLIARAIYPSSEEEDEIIQLIFSECRQLLNSCYALNMLSSQNMRDILNDALDCFTLEQKQSLAEVLNQDYFHIYSQFNQGYERKDEMLQILTQIAATYDSQFIIRNPNSSLDLTAHATLFSEKILSYLSYKDLVTFAATSLQCFQIYKAHLKFRVSWESQQLRQFELENKPLIRMIQKKRSQKRPDKELAYGFITSLQASDISELRQVVHPNQLYDQYAKPFVVLLELKGRPSEWESLHKFLLDPHAFARLQEVRPEVLGSLKVIQLRALVEAEEFDMGRLEKVNLSFFKLAQWLHGIVILNQYLRRYCLTHHDASLSAEEQELFQLIDRKQLIIYKATRYLNK